MVNPANSYKTSSIQCIAAGIGAALFTGAAVVGAVFLATNFHDILHSQAACYGVGAGMGASTIMAIILGFVAKRSNDVREQWKPYEIDSSKWTPNKTWLTIKMKNNQTLVGLFLSTFDKTTQLEMAGVMLNFNGIKTPVYAHNISSIEKFNPPG